MPGIRNPSHDKGDPTRFSGDPWCNIVLSNLILSLDAPLQRKAFTRYSDVSAPAKCAGGQDVVD